MYFKVLLQGVDSNIKVEAGKKTKESHSVTVYIPVNHGMLQWGQGSTLGNVFTGQGGEGGM